MLLRSFQVLLRVVCNYIHHQNAKTSIYCPVTLLLRSGREKKFGGKWLNLRAARLLIFPFNRKDSFSNDKLGKDSESPIRFSPTLF